MALKQAEENIEANERWMNEMREMILSFNKTVERLVLAVEVRDKTTSTVTGNVVQDRKGKEKEGEPNQSKLEEEDDEDSNLAYLKEGRLKFKRLEMSMFDG